MGALLLTALAGLAAAAPARAAGSWHDGMSPHFHIRHENPFMPPGFTMQLERMHSRLRLDLAMFAPWMAKERLNLYLYRNSETYAAGEFSPPSWSNGIAIPSKRTVAVPDKEDRRQLLGTIAHETTHLLFQSYWDEAKKSPPAWLNEGLATMEEAEAPAKAASSVWYNEMVLLSEGAPMPLERFFAITPVDDRGLSSDELRGWYAQAFSIVSYLFQRHTRLQFKSFVASLRDGKTIEEALWLTYRYRNLEKFRDAWLVWLRDPKHRTAVEAAAALPEDAPQPFAKPIGQLKGLDAFRP